MAERIKQFLKNKKVEKQFKKAGRGHKLNEAPVPTSESPLSNANASQSSSSGNPHRAEPSEVAARAGAAALARLGGNKDVNWSLAAIRAQARKEIELEQQCAVAKARKEDLAPQVTEKPVQLGVQGLLFRCPLLGPQALPRNELDEQLKAFLFEQLAEEKGLSAALIIATCNKNETAVRSCVEILSKYLTNILENPGEEKYRKIKLSNRVFQEKVQPIVGSIEFLEAAGFSKTIFDDGEAYFVLREDADLDLVPALKDALVSAEALEIVLDRNPKVLLPSQSLANFSVPDDFYSVTADEIAKEQANRSREAELITQLRTKAMRERDQKRENCVYKYALIRVRLPNGFILQGTFDITETLAEVYEFVNDCLLETCSIAALKSGSEALVAHERTIEELKLFPAVVLNCVVDAPADSDILRPELLALVQNLD